MVTERMPDVRSVTTGFWVGTGSRDEDGAVAGASHFLEHLLFKGTGDRSARDIAEAVDAVGGDMNAFTTKEYTAFYLRLLADSLDLGLDILSDIMWAPAFRPDEFEAERQVILEEILMHADEPADLVHDVFAEALFPVIRSAGRCWATRPPSRPCPGARSPASTRDHYRPGNIVVAAAGDLDHDEVAAGIERRFAGQPGGGSADRGRCRSSAPQPLSVRAPADRAGPPGVGAPALDRDDEDRYALAVLNHVLGGGMSSRLFQEIREERGLAYSVYSYRARLRGPGALAVYAGTAPSPGPRGARPDQRRARPALRRRHHRAGADAGQGPSAGSMALALEDSGARMSRIGRSQLVHGRVPTIDEIDAGWPRSTLDDVARVAAAGARRRRAPSRSSGPFDTERRPGSDLAGAQAQG